MFGTVVVTHGSNKMLIKLILEKAGKREVESVLEFTQHWVWAGVLGYMPYGLGHMQYGLGYIQYGLGYIRSSI